MRRQNVLPAKEPDKPSQGSDREVATQPAPSMDVIIGADSSSESGLDNDPTDEGVNSVRRVQFAEQLEDHWYDSSVSMDGKCARWLGMESSPDDEHSPRNMKSLYDELVEAEQANQEEIVENQDDNGNESDDINDLERKKDLVARKLGLAGVVKGYIKKLKKQISNKEDTKKGGKTAGQAEASSLKDDLDNLTPVLEYKGFSETASYDVMSDSDSSSVMSDRSDPVSIEITSSQEWDQIQSGIYCKVDKSDRLSREDIRPVEGNNRAGSTGSLPRFRKNGQFGGSLQDIRTQETQAEKRLYPKGILKNSNLNLNLETRSEGGDSEFEDCVMANAGSVDTLDDLDAPVLYAISTDDDNVEVVISAPESLPPEVCSDEDVFGLSDDNRSVASDSVELSKDCKIAEITQAPGVSNLRKKFSKSEPALNQQMNEPPKRRKSSVVADKVKKYMDKIKDASTSSTRRMSLPGKSKKYDFQKQFKSKFGNDEFVMKPNYHLRMEADHKEDNSTPGNEFTPNSACEDPDVKHRRDHRLWSVTSSDDGLDNLDKNITLTVLDTSSPVAPPRLSKRHSVAIPVIKVDEPESCGDFKGNNADAAHDIFETPPSNKLIPKAKTSIARKLGIAGAVKSYARRFQRRKSESDLKKAVEADLKKAQSALDINQNNNNIMQQSHGSNSDLAGERGCSAKGEGLEVPHSQSASGAPRGVHKSSSATSFTLPPAEEPEMNADDLLERRDCISSILQRRQKVSVLLSYLLLCKSFWYFSARHGCYLQDCSHHHIYFPCLFVDLLFICCHFKFNSVDLIARPLCNS